MRNPRRFFVYVMTNGQRSHVLYTGVTGNLTRRVFEHKNRLVPGFTSRYNLTRLVYYQEFIYPDAAIAHEKEIKGWRRGKKIHVIESMNPLWRDLAEKWQDIYKPDAAVPENTGRSRPARDPSLRLKNGSGRDDAAEQIPHRHRRFNHAQSCEQKLSSVPVTFPHSAHPISAARNRANT